MLCTAVVYTRSRARGHVRYPLSPTRAPTTGGNYYAPFALLPIWQREMERAGRVFPPKDGGKKKKGDAGEMGHGAATWVIALAAAVLVSYGMEALLVALGTRTVGEAAVRGAWVAAVFVVPSFAINYAFGGFSLTLLALDGTYIVAHLATNAALLTALRLHA